MVSISPWPLFGSLSLLGMVVNFFGYISKMNSFTVLLLGLSPFLLVIIQWWRDVVRESTFQGCHTSKVCDGLYLGVVMFILSEVMFFFSFFFGYFYSSLSPDIEIGATWPPLGIQPLSFIQVPLLNTILLLSSGVSITWAHHSMIEGMKSEALKSGLITIILGSVFTFLQWMEYKESAFTMADCVFGSFFFLMTGFHGLHVLIGAMAITVMTYRLSLNHFSSSHHLGFEASAWYWHFVDVVWLFLYVWVYWWSC